MVKFCPNFFVLDKIFFGDVIEGVYIEISASLQRLSILDLLLLDYILIFFDLLLSHFDFFLPTERAVELLVILGKIEATIIQRFIEISSCNLLAYFDEFLSASGKLISFLNDPRQQNTSSYLWIPYKNTAYILIWIKLIYNSLDKGRLKLGRRLIASRQ